MSGPGSVTGTYQSCSSPAAYNSLADGSYTFSVRAIDAASNIDATPATRSFTIVPATQPPAFPPPAPYITAPTSYAWNRTSAMLVTGTAEAGSTVELFDDSASLGTTVATASGSWSRTITLTDGGHLVTAKATSLGGTSPASAIKVIMVDTRAPAAPSFTAPAAGSTVATSFTLTGTAESGTTLELFDNGISQGTIAAMGGTWSRQMSGVVSGTHSFTARVTDLAGNVSAMSAGWSLRVGT